MQAYQKKLLLVEKLSEISEIFEKKIPSKLRSKCKFLKKLSLDKQLKILGLSKKELAMQLTGNTQCH